MFLLLLTLNKNIFVRFASNFSNSIHIHSSLALCGRSHQNSHWKQKQKWNEKKQHKFPQLVLINTYKVNNLLLKFKLSKYFIRTWNKANNCDLSRKKWEAINNQKDRKVPKIHKNNVNKTIFIYLFYYL